MTENTHTHIYIYIYIYTQTYTHIYLVELLRAQGEWWYGSTHS